MTEEPQPDPASVRARLLSARRDLVDIGGRTRLLNTRLGAAGVIHIVGELADEMHRHLVMDGRTMSLEPRVEAPRSADVTVVETASPKTQPQPGSAKHAAQPDAVGLELPDAATVLFGASTHRDEAGATESPEVDLDEVDPEEGDSASADPTSADGPLPHQVDSRLQTDLAEDVLERRLLRLAYDARTAQEEQGVNLLHLAIGFVRWREDDKDGAERVAPLLLVPVQLERQGAGSRFRLVHLGDEIVANVSLQERLRSAFGIELPRLDEDEESTPSGYISRVAAAIAGREGWEVLRDEAALGLFSFAGFLMWRDLDPAGWPEGKGPDAHPVVEGLLGGRCPSQPPAMCGEEDRLDSILSPERCLHVLDADSSQAIAIAEVVHGRRSMVIQGPPGTGKSQTIANIIAAAIAEGRRVLFVAEKRAALEVVQRRLDTLGLGVACLELHSTRANRRAVLQAIDETLQLGRPRTPERSSHLERLRATVARLNAQTDRMHERDPVSGRTLHEVLGEVIRLQALGHAWRRVKLDNAEAWDETRRSEAIDHVRALVHQVGRIGTPRDHPWRGVGLSSLLPTDLPGLREVILTAQIAWQRAIKCVDAVTAALGGTGSACPPEPTVRDVARLVDLAVHLGARPAGAATVDAETWNLHAAAIDAALARLTEWRHLRDEIDPLLAPGVAEQPLGALRDDLATIGASPLRFLRPRWWAARRRFRAMLAPGTQVSDPVALLDRIRAAQALSQSIVAETPLLARAFGSLWVGEATDLARLAEVRAWIAAGRDAAHPADPLHMASCEVGASVAASAADALCRAEASLAALVSTLALDAQSGLGVATPELVRVAELTARLDEWAARTPAQAEVELDGWIAWHRRRLDAVRAGLGGAVAALEEGVIAPEQLEAQVLINAAEVLMRRLDPDNEVLRADGVERQRLRDEFAQLDRQRIALARAEVALAHFERLPASTDSLGQMSVLRREIVKRRRHLSIRRLLTEAGETVQRIRPVFMMSPPSVAQFLEPGRLEFDLVLMDEASQVRPVEALGAVARLAPDGQVVVVGDDRQLPPTSFFRAMIEEDGDIDASEESLESVRDVESVLGLCIAAGLPSRMLRWHYRSEHHSLIAVSNRAFYDSRLFVIPSPHDRNEERGLLFRHLPQAAYDRGGSGTNRAEAEAVADAVMAHAARWPDLTLGVGTFSVRQRDAVQECLERRRRERPELESFFGDGAGTAEPFFVKNLENIQGDERDVILISVGYGRSPEGHMTMNFGPVSQDGGQRRLNVLITRARRRCVVFSSITDEDIDLARASGLGPQSLKMFLRYAQLGEMDVGLPTRRDFGSEFERQVAAALSALGWRVEAQVGVAGFFVDLAVCDPDRPGRFLLGIECDGASYHSARWARDRDRLRQAVLEARGWRIHRVWSTDWFRRRDAELERLVAVLDAQLQAARRADEAALASTPEIDATDSSEGPESELVSAPSRPPAPPIERDAPPETGMSADLTESYREARVRVPVRSAPQDVATERLAEIIMEVVRQEGPVHESELSRRVAALWGLRRAGSRIDEATRAAIAMVTADHRVRRDGHFLEISPLEAVGTSTAVEPPTARRPRRRDASVAASLRRPESLPPSEIRTLLRLVVERHYGIAREALLAETRRQFGYGALSAALRSVLETQLDALLLDGSLIQRSEGLFAADGASALR